MMAPNPDKLFNDLFNKVEQKFPPAKHLPTYSYLALILGITIVAAFIRLINYDLVPLWLDEAWRANLILDPDAFEKLLGTSVSGAISTFGYVAFNKCIAWVQASEAALRLSSLIPSIATIPLIISIVRMVTSYRSLGLIAGIVLALNPNTVDFARELKPYSFELFIHLFSIFLTLKYVLVEDNEKSYRLLYAMLAWWLVSILSATNFVFLFPGSVLYVLIHQYRNKAYVPLLTTVFAAIIISGVALALYVWVWSAATKSEGLISFWVNNFHMSDDGHYLTWIADHIRAMFEGAHSHAGSIWDGQDTALLCLFIIGIVACCLAGPVERVLFIFSPLLLMVLLNAKMMWPIGFIRVNLFSYGYFVIVTMMGLGAIARFMALRWAALGYFLFVGFVALQHVDSVYSIMIPPRQEVPSMLVGLKNRAGACNEDQKITVVQHPAVSHAMQYYLNHHPTLSKKLRPYFTDCVNLKSIPEAYSSPEKVTKDLAEFFDESKEIWFVYSHINKDGLMALTDIIDRYATIEIEEHYYKAGLFLAIRRD